MIDGIGHFWSGDTSSTRKRVVFTSQTSDFNTASNLSLTGKHFEKPQNNFEEIQFHMGMLATYIAIEGERLDNIWDLPDAEFRNAFLEIESDRSLPRLEIDKIWDALHFTLTGKSASEPIEGDRLSESIVGTYPRIFEDDDYSVFVSVIDNEEIREILDALSSIDREKLAGMFDPQGLKRNKVYPSGIWNDPPEQLIDEMSETIRSIKQFFETISDTDLHILATVL